MKKLLKKSILLPFAAIILLTGGSVSAMVGQMKAQENPAPKVGISVPVGTQPTAKEQAIIDDGTQTVAEYTNSKGVHETIAKTALDANGVYHGPDANGCWNFTMNGINIPMEVKQVCSDADVMAFRNDYLARDKSQAPVAPPTPSPAQMPNVPEATPAPTPVQ